MVSFIDHIHITVRDIGISESFYNKFLPLVGFDLRDKEYAQVPEHAYELIEYNSASFSFGIVSPRAEYLDDCVSRRRPGAVHHVAFGTREKVDVDSIFSAVQSIPNVRIINKPCFYPEYCDDYYAFFFTDCDGIELEVVNYSRTSRIGSSLA
ncbi:VOC family protein [Parasphaerochaeta coccoides]|uniref:Glyoxalase/bleomycin resistance protein/dioxygenase n=1 Tax=Parasphaerochaeta coccoides (strain ATCC BAA-1237 / DSM 17374 / SPN1) TaxID=760011 RepID=F4GHV3_PARC1|nr:VOC family protein [Parasphaerochaeta coccoides]AEC02066.1 Glyoxalase/bleomycin resistance protein/dioxygenase [Parasphaerochaeta coccoides DSM 17374]